METITIETIVGGQTIQVWDYYNQPIHMVEWNFANDNWCCPWAENDLYVGGCIKTRMEAKDGSMGFDFEGHYLEVDVYKKLIYQIADGRKVKVLFDSMAPKQTKITQIIEVEQINDLELQKNGWTAILENFKKHFMKNNL